MPKRRARFLWVTDPWKTLDHARDTTLRLAREAAAQGHDSYWCDVRSIRLENSTVLLDAALISAEPPDPARAPGPMSAFAPSRFSSVHYRVDPPVDLSYLHPLQLLKLGKARIVNPAETLFMKNEKLEASLLPALMPESCVSSRWEDLLAFGKRQQRTVLKPLHQAQSKGVRLLSWISLLDEEQNRAILSEASSEFSVPVLLQKYLAGISAGEQRLWFLDGKLLASVRKMPLKNDFRVNIDRGSALRKTTLTAGEKRTAARIGKFLRENRIRLAAVDLIEGLVTDFNFTSPGLITQMESVLGLDLARPIVRALARGPGR